MNLVKPGYKTTEFWLSVVASLISILYASGVISPDGASTVEQVVAMIAAALASLGYSVARGIAKRGGDWIDYEE
jgi:hypothetical protein